MAESPSSPNLPVQPGDAGGHDLDFWRLQEPPPVFTPGEKEFWTVAHIARQLLAAHLSPETDAASRRPETIQRSVEWIAGALNLQPGQALLDLGCGPGLYAVRLARLGLEVTGVDFSPGSIEYARAAAAQAGLPGEFRCQDYLTLEDTARFEAALLIYGDFCPLAPGQRARLLANVRRALKPGGWFVLDVSTPGLRRRYGLKNGWYLSAGGFWRPGPHLVLEQGFAYPGEIFLDQYVILEAGEKVSVYRNWFQDYTAEAIRAELEAGGFRVDSLWGDLTGAPFDPDGDWIGVVARRA